MSSSGKIDIDTLLNQNLTLLSIDGSSIATGWLVEGKKEIYPTYKCYVTLLF